MQDLETNLITVIKELEAEFSQQCPTPLPAEKLGEEYEISQYNHQNISTTQFSATQASSTGAYTLESAEPLVLVKTRRPDDVVILRAKLNATELLTIYNSDLLKHLLRQVVEPMYSHLWNLKPRNKKYYGGPYASLARPGGRVLMQFTPDIYEIRLYSSTACL